MPTDHARPPVPSRQAETLAFRVPATLVRDLKTLAQRFGSLQIVLLAAYIALLKYARVCGGWVVCG